MAGTNIFILSPKIYKALVTRGMDLRCKCTIGGDGPCNIMLQPFDKVVSKPSKKGRKYYLYDHFMEMFYNNHNNGNGDNNE